jgi:hypothetical protein
MLMLSLSLHVGRYNSIQAYQSCIGRTYSFSRRAVANFLSSPQQDWVKQGENHGKYDFTVYYKVEEGARLTCRVESPIPVGLLVPVLSVLNESDLYETWIPYWKRPFRMGVRRSRNIFQDTRGHQVIQVQCDVPWPVAPREALFDVQAVDDIDEHGFIVAKMTSLDEGVATNLLPDSFRIPDLADGTERCDFDGAVLFRACPTDHPDYASTKTKFPNEDLLLLQFMMYFDAHMAFVPHSMINFVTRTAMGMIWNQLLTIAEQVRDGKREGHRDAIAKKAAFYEWMEGRCRQMNAPSLSCKPQEHQQEQYRNGGMTLNDVLRMTI